MRSKRAASGATELGRLHAAPEHDRIASLLPFNFTMGVRRMNADQQRDRGPTERRGQPMSTCPIASAVTRWLRPDLCDHRVRRRAHDHWNRDADATQDAVKILGTGHYERSRRSSAWSR
jgi:hypothetical protein